MRALRQHKSLGLVPALLWLALQFMMASSVAHGLGAPLPDTPSFTYTDLCVPSGAKSADLGSQDHSSVPHCPWCRGFVALPDLGDQSLVSLGLVPLEPQQVFYASFALESLVLASPVGSRAPPCVA